MSLIWSSTDDFFQLLTALLLLITSIGVVSLTNPVHASISFLFTLFLLASLFVELSAEFIGIMQLLVYAGAILVIFMFVIILFQDAHQEISKFKAKTNHKVLLVSGIVFLASILLFISNMIKLSIKHEPLEAGFGTVQSLGESLYIDFFFPFEAVVFLFLVAIVGAFYIGKGEIKT